MMIEEWFHNDHSGSQITLVTLAKGERHEWNGFVSRGPGHVWCYENPSDIQWEEYDLNDPRFRAREAYLVQSPGWRLDGAWEA